MKDQTLLRIAHDIDMVQFPFFDSFFSYLRAEGIDIHPTMLDRYNFIDFLEERLNITHDQTRRYLRAWGNNALHTQPPYPEAVTSFNTVAKKKDVELHAITARSQGQSGFYDRSHSQTIQWFMKFGYKINIQRIHFRKDKTACMNEQGIDVLVEDHPYNAYDAAASGKTVILMDHPYNQTDLHERDVAQWNISTDLWKEYLETGKIIRVYSHAEIEQVVDRIVHERLTHQPFKQF